jgi:hypothetical protein
LAKQADSLLVSWNFQDPQDSQDSQNLKSAIDSRLAVAGRAQDDLDFISVAGVRQVVYAKKALWLGERLKAVTALQHRTSGDGQKRQ